MQPLRTLTLCLAWSMLAACSWFPHVRPINSINDPVFHAPGYAAIGGTLIKAFNGPGTHLDPDQSTFEFQPILLWETTSSPAVSHSIIPVYWEFLITGDQYRDSVHLIPHKLHATIHGGMTGIEYTWRDDWVFPADIGVKAKYLIDDAQYLVSDASLELFHVLRLRRNFSHLHLLYGFQADEWNALELSYRVSYFLIEPGAYATKFGIPHSKGDFNNEVFLNHWHSFRGHHLLGPEVGWGFRNLDYGTEAYFLAGLSYRYVFR